MKKMLLCLLSVMVAAGICFGLSGCSPNPEVTGYQPNPNLDKDATVRLTVVGTMDSCKAIETVGAAFKEIYPNLTIVYEKVDDYYVNVPARMKVSTPAADEIDIFFAGGIQSDSKDLSVFQDYALNLLSASGLDLSDTFEPLSENFRRREDTSIQYSIPVGAEMRGMFINVSLLKQVGIESIPVNQKQFLDACAVLKAAGYVPLQGNPGSGNIPSWFLYPWIVNQIANAADPDAARQAVENHDGAVVTELFKEPMTFLYNMCANGYYDYKYSQSEWDLFNDITTEATARSILNIVRDENNEGSFKNGEGAGLCAFVPAPMSFMDTVESIKKDYNNKTEYVFVPSPIGEDGGYVYLSPANGLAINKNSSKLDWAVEFMNFFFTTEMNEVFAEEAHVLPNTSTVYEYLNELYSVPEQNTCHLGEVTFSWNFYTAVTRSLQPLAKANKPSTVEANGGTMIELQWYLDKMTTAINTGEADTSETKS